MSTTVARWLAVGASLTFARAALANEKIAVMPTQYDTSAVGKVPDLLDDYFLTAVQNLGSYEAIGKTDIEALLGFEDQKDLLGCDDASCMANIGGALGVDKLVSIKIGNLGGEWVVTAKLINIRETRVESRVSKIFAGDIKALFENAVPIIEELFGRKTVSAPSRSTPSAPPQTTPPPGTATVASTVKPASTGWSMAGAIIGFGSAAFILALGGASEATVQEGPELSGPLGGAMIVVTATAVPLTFVAGTTPREHPQVDGIAGLRVTGWIAYGITLVYDLALLVTGLTVFDEGPPSGTIVLGALGGATAATFMAIDTLKANFEAKAVSPGSSAGASAITLQPMVRLARERDLSGSYPVMGMSLGF